jgi:HK97 gp10 family phage protein
MPSKVEGAAQLQSSLSRAAQQIADMPASVHREAGSIVVDAVSSLAPRRSGRLAASFRAQTAGDGATVTSSARYGGYVNYGTRYQRGQQFVDRGLDAATEPVAEVYLAEVDRALGQVKGA